MITEMTINEVMRIAKRYKLEADLDHEIEYKRVATVIDETGC